MFPDLRNRQCLCLSLAAAFLLSTNSLRPYMVRNKLLPRSILQLAVLSRGSTTTLFREGSKTAESQLWLASKLHLAIRYTGDPLTTSVSLAPWKSLNGFYHNRGCILPINTHTHTHTNRQRECRDHCTTKGTILLITHVDICSRGIHNLFTCWAMVTECPLQYFTHKVLVIHN